MIRICAYIWCIERCVDKVQMSKLCLGQFMRLAMFGRWELYNLFIMSFLDVSYPQTREDMTISLIGNNSSQLYLTKQLKLIKSCDIANQRHFFALMPAFMFPTACIPDHLSWVTLLKIHIVRSWTKVLFGDSACKAVFFKLHIVRISIVK